MYKCIRMLECKTKTNFVYIMKHIILVKPQNLWLKHAILCLYGTWYVMQHRVSAGTYTIVTWNIMYKSQRS